MLPVPARPEVRRTPIASRTALQSQRRANDEPSRTGRCFRPRVYWLTAAIGLLALGLASSSNGSASCGSLRAYYSEHGTRQYVEASRIRATHLSCRTARRVARDWAADSRLSIDPADSGAGFPCTYHRLGTDVGTTTCRKGTHAVRFGAYDSSPYH